MAAFLVVCAWAGPVHAWMWEVSDEELSEVTGEGFSSFTLEGDVVRAYFDITAQTYTQIDSLKMGYYSRDGIAAPGWDQDWVGVSLGSPNEDLVCRGFFIEAGFSQISDPGARSLSYLKFGTPSMTGPVSADFRSFTGRIQNGATYVDYDRFPLGQKTIYSSNGEFSVTLDGSSGWRMFWGNATVTP